MYIMFMVQHKKNGENIIATPSQYNSTDEWKQAFYHEMDYAISSLDISGVSILVTDISLQRVFANNWERQTSQSNNN